VASRIAIVPTRLGRQNNDRPLFSVYLQHGPVLSLAPSAFKRSIRRCLLCQLSPSANMPPVQASATQPFSGDCHSTLVDTLTYVILSLSFIFVLFLACRSIIRRHRPIHDNAHLSAIVSPPRLLSNEEWRAKTRMRAFPTVSTLVAQSTIASNPLHLNMISETGPPPSRDRNISLLSGLRPLRKCRAPSLFSQQPNGSNGKERAARPQKYLRDRTEPVADIDDEPERDIRIDLHSTHDAQFKIEAPMIPSIILSLPSSEHLIGDPPPPPVSLDEYLLSPDGTFRSTGRAADDTHDFIDTLPVLASRLRERRKRHISFPSTDVLSSPGMAYWPRWF